MNLEANKEYSVNWKNHMSHVRKAFDHLLTSNELTDVTLCCEGKKMGAHKILLSACSAYFRDTFKEVPCQHPVIILYGVEYSVLLDILRFIYNGEVSVDTSKLDSFLKLAQMLQISGLTDNHNEKIIPEGNDKSQATTSSQATQEIYTEQYSTTAMPDAAPTSGDETKKGIKRSVSTVKQQETPSTKIQRQDENALFISDVKCEPSELVNFEDPLEDPLQSDQSQDTREFFGDVVTAASQNSGEEEFKMVIDAGFPRRRNVQSEIFTETDEYTFYKRFRLTKATTRTLFESIEDRLTNPSHKNNSMSPMNRLLVFLRFIGSSGHVDSVAAYFRTDVSRASRTICHVTKVIASLLPQFIRMPSLPADILETKMKFYDIAGFPRVLGCIDGTHIRIVSTGEEDKEIFRNRKKYLSVNVQLVSDATMKILNVVARWPGSQRDITVFNHSRISARFEANEFPNSFLLGDCAYALENYLLTPFPNPTTKQQLLYNDAHIRTRNSTERLFAVWKRRFPALAFGMRIELSTVLAIIVAAGVLHNVALASNEVEPPPAEGIDQEDLEELIREQQIEDRRYNAAKPGAEETRNVLINTFFASL